MTPLAIAGQLMAAVDQGLALAQQSQRERENGQISLLDLMGERAREVVSISLPDLPEFPEDEMLAMEKEVLGLYISGHPLDQYRSALNRLCTSSAAEISELAEDSAVVLGDDHRS